MYNTPRCASNVTLYSSYGTQQTSSGSKILMRSSRVVRASGCQWQSRNSRGVGSIPESSDTMEFEGRQMKQCWITYIKNTVPLQIFVLF